MKHLLITLIFLGTVAQANTRMVCYGVKDNKGARAQILFQGHAFTLDGNENAALSSNPSATRPLKCEGGFDFAYKPRTSNPRYDRYNLNWTPNGPCSYWTAMISRNIESEGKGFVSLLIEGGHPGEFDEAAYFCKVAE